ncbi:DUF1971 domain-containing protein [Brevundimonas naejangsanensis]|uniref:DUF1971 domain-containing protein n=1 Tax=Brevundimonas naejangsanensis TaxID=588932 RepID=UPI0026EC7218|nr:DUF1971 domain-containing protein [Brevundimonas naejangsanensis]
MTHENPKALPSGLAPYRSTAVFTQNTVPAGLLADHRTKDGVWGLIHVLSGQLLYSVTDPRRAASERLLTPGAEPGVVEPAVLHRVEPNGDVQFLVEFWRAAGEG